MAININSEAYCRKAYLNYHCYGNSMNISAEDMGKITEAWKGRISSWQASVSNDENVYEFNDSEYSNFKAEGRNAGEETTGHDGGNSGFASVNHGLAGAGGAGYNLATGGFKELKNLTNFKKSGGGMGDSKNWKKSKKGDSKGKTSAYVQAALAIATAAAYRISKPNKAEKEACDALQTEMLGAQSTLSETQSDMQSRADELITLSDTALYLNKETNEDIKEEKSEQDLYYESLLRLQEKIKSGKPLTDSEKELYNDVIGYIDEIRLEIDALSRSASDEIRNISDEMETYQDAYDTDAQTISEIEGLTDFAEDFDSATQTFCYIEAAGQGLNAANGAMAGAKLMASGFWNWALGIASIAAGASSLVAAGEQKKYAGEVGTEIEMRKNTQLENIKTNDMFTEEIDAYDGWMEGVQQANELEIPDDLKSAEDIRTLPNEEKTGVEAVPDELKPKQKEKEKENEKQI